MCEADFDGAACSVLECIVYWFDCILGHCLCEADFGGADCSVNITHAPEFWRLHMNGFCDISDGACDTIVVYGDQFYKSDDLVCELQKIEVNFVLFNSILQNW